MCLPFSMGGGPTAGRRAPSASLPDPVRVEPHLLLHGRELVVHRGGRAGSGVLGLQGGDGVLGLGVELLHGVGAVEHLVGLGLHALEGGHGALGAVGAAGHAAHLVLGLGDGGLGLDDVAAALEGVDVVHELVVHLAHLLCVLVGGVVGGDEAGVLGHELLLLGQERAGVALLAGGEGAAGEAVVLVDVGLVGVDQPLAAGLLGHDAGGGPLDLGEALGEVAEVLVDHLGGVLRLVEQVVHVGLDDGGETVEDAHGAPFPDPPSGSSRRRNPTPCPRTSSRGRRGPGRQRSQGAC